MYAAEASMAATSFFRNPVRIRPTSHNILITKSLVWNHSMKCQCSSTSSSSVSVDDKSVFSVTSASKYDVDYLGEKTKGYLNVKVEHLEAFGMDGQVTLEGPMEEVARMEAEEAEGLLKDLGIPGACIQGEVLRRLRIP